MSTEKKAKMEGHKKKEKKEEEERKERKEKRGGVGVGGMEGEKILQRKKLRGERRWGRKHA